MQQFQNLKIFSKFSGGGRVTTPFPNVLILSSKPGLHHPKGILTSFVFISVAHRLGAKCQTITIRRLLKHITRASDSIVFDSERHQLVYYYY